MKQSSMYERFYDKPCLIHRCRCSMVPVDLPTKLDEKCGIHVDNYSSTKHMGFFFFRKPCFISCYKPHECYRYEMLQDVVVSKTIVIGVIDLMKNPIQSQ